MPPSFCSKECKINHKRKKYKQYNQTLKRKEYNLNHRRKRKGYTEKIKKCLVCEKDFSTFKKTKIHCSKDCAAKFKIQYDKKYFSRPDVKVRVNQLQKIYRTKLTNETKKKYSERYKIYRTKNKDKIKQQQKDWYSKPENKIKVRIRQNTPERKRAQYAYFRKRRKNDPNYRMIHNLRGALGKLIIRNQKIIKNKRTKELIGCSVEELKAHIEKQFLPGMSWDNYGYKTWHIDHIRPLSSAKTMDDIIRLNLMHYTNLQPLWAKDNLKKSDLILGVRQREQKQS